MIIMLGMLMMPMMLTNECDANDASHANGDMVSSWTTSVTIKNISPLRLFCYQ